LSRSRELDFNLTDRSQELKVTVLIRTEPDVPIKEVYGHLAFIKDDQIVYETQLAEKPDVSFTDSCCVILRIPYDDNNPKHRTLRFAKDGELTPVFTVRKVVLADGTEKTFEEYTHTKQDDLAAATENELDVLKAKPGFPSIAGNWTGFWQRELDKYPIIITQNADKFIATCTFPDKEHGEISWRMTGTISKDGIIEGTLVFTKDPDVWQNQIRTGKFSATNGTITGYSMSQSGVGTNFTWKRLDK
jgi:hypothetical protein